MGRLLAQRPTLVPIRTTAPPVTPAVEPLALAGIKVGCSSVGTAIAGTILGLGGRTMFVIAAALTLATLAYLFIDRRAQASQ